MKMHVSGNTIKATDAWYFWEHEYFVSMNVIKSTKQMYKNRPRTAPFAGKIARAVVLRYVHEQYVQKYGAAQALLRLYIPALKKAAEWVKIAASSGTAAALEYQQDAARSPSISLFLCIPQQPSSS